VAFATADFLVGTTELTNDEVGVNECAVNLERV
jgi:hypothetical protein